MAPVRNKQREQQMSKETSKETPKAATHSAGWQPATFYPDPAIHALDPRFEKYWLKLSAVERLATGLRWGESPRISPTATPATARAGSSPANMAAAASPAPNMTARSPS